MKPDPAADWPHSENQPHYIIIRLNKEHLSVLDVD